MPDESYQADNDEKLSCIYGRLLQSCANTVSADDRDAYDRAVADCVDCLRQLGTIKGLASEAIATSVSQIRHPFSKMPYSCAGRATEAPSILIDSRTLITICCLH